MPRYKLDEKEVRHACCYDTAIVDTRNGEFLCEGDWDAMQLICNTLNEANDRKLN